MYIRILLRILNRKYIKKISKKKIKKLVKKIKKFFYNKKNNFYINYNIYILTIQFIKYTNKLKLTIVKLNLQVYYC